jgi:hypothetical protein
MGGGTGGYVTITLQTLLSKFGEPAGHLHRVSELSFKSAPIPDDPTHEPPRDIAKADPGPPPAWPAAGKVGLGGVKPRDVAAFNLFARLDDGSLAGMGVQKNAAVTEELEDAFGGSWAGFAVALAPTGGRFRLVADITLKFRTKQKASKPFQVTPIVMAFGADRFVDHYLLSVIVAQETVEKVDTSVTQPFQ